MLRNSFNGADRYASHSKNAWSWAPHYRRLTEKTVSKQKAVVMDRLEPCTASMGRSGGGPHSSEWALVKNNKIYKRILAAAHYRT
jgi:hypothetical protein